jgi:hypothetical protein
MFVVYFGGTVKQYYNFMRGIPFYQPSLQIGRAKILAPNSTQLGVPVFNVYRRKWQP